MKQGYDYSNLTKVTRNEYSPQLTSCPQCKRDYNPYITELEDGVLVTYQQKKCPRCILGYPKKIYCDICKKEITESDQHSGYFLGINSYAPGKEYYNHNPRHSTCGLSGLFTDGILITNT